MRRIRSRSPRRRKIQVDILIPNPFPQEDIDAGYEVPHHSLFLHVHERLMWEYDMANNILFFKFYTYNNYDDEHEEYDGERISLLEFVSTYTDNNNLRILAIPVFAPEIPDIPEPESDAYLDLAWLNATNFPNY